MIYVGNITEFRTNAQENDARSGSIFYHVFSDNSVPELINFAKQVEVEIEEKNLWKVGKTPCFLVTYPERHKCLEAGARKANAEDYIRVLNYWTMMGE